jgi:hypothetical protein
MPLYLFQENLTEEQRRARAEAEAKLRKEAGKIEELAQKQTTETVNEKTTVPVTTTTHTTKVKTVNKPARR